MRYALYIILVASLAGCATVSSNFKQGIEGQVFWVSGNRMPGPDTKLAAPSPVTRWVIVTHVVKSDRMPVLNDGLYPSLPVQAVDSVQSDTNGKFRLGLAPGSYSVFTREPNGYFANSFDSEGNVNHIKVSENDYSEIKLEINYKAVY